jgi:hypothetical protein
MIDQKSTPYNMDDMARFYAKKGLIIVPMTESIMSSGFSHKQSLPSKSTNNDRVVYRSVVAKNIEDAEEFIHHHVKNDHIKIGEMLGYPSSSCYFFDDVWSKGYIDPIWQQAENTSSEIATISNNEGAKILSIKENNDYYMIGQVFRYIGARLTSHLPRSYDDRESLEVAKNYLKVAKDNKLVGIGGTLEILRLPYEWSCYEGVADVSTPFFNITVNSVPCSERHIIKQDGSLYR